MVFSKINCDICCLKDKMARKPVRSPLCFHFLQVTHFSLSNSCSTVQTEQRFIRKMINLFFSERVTVSIYDWPLGVNIPGISSDL